MRSTQRGRSRSRLRTSKPVNIMFSNGLGVCRSYAGAGQNSVCRRRTRDVTQPSPELYVITTSLNPLLNDNLDIFTNIIGATITISTASLPTPLTILLPLPPISIYGGQTLTFNQTGGPAETVYNGAILTLTGGTVRAGGSHGTTSITLPSFTVDTEIPVLTIGSQVPLYSNNNGGAFDKVTFFTLTSTKAGTLPFVIADGLGPAAFTVQSLDIPAGGPATSYQLQTPMVDTAFAATLAKVTAASGRVSVGTSVSAFNPGVPITGTLLAPQTPPDNAFVLDRTPPPAPTSPADARIANNTFEVIFPTPAADQAPFENQAGDGTSLIITGSGTNGGLAWNSSILSMDNVTPTSLQITCNGLISQTTAGNELTLEYKSGLAVAGNELIDRAGNLVASFGPLNITITSP